MCSICQCSAKIKSLLGKNNETSAKITNSQWYKVPTKSIIDHLSDTRHLLKLYLYLLFVTFVNKNTFTFYSSANGYKMY